MCVCPNELGTLHIRTLGWQKLFCSAKNLNKFCLQQIIYYVCTCKQLNIW